MYLLVCYDIPSDARRARLHRRLRGFLLPVQRSVLEGVVPQRRYGALLQLIEDTIDPREDNVRIYQLCRGCRGLIDALGVSPPPAGPPEDIFI